MPANIEFPAEAIDILRQARFNPDAKRSFDGMSGGFLWGDEFPKEPSAPVCKWTTGLFAQSLAIVLH
jgi:hypothetical protein